MRRLLLLSNSTNHAQRYLDHAMPAIPAVLGTARLQASGLLEAVRHRALGGLPYLGASAGTNVAAPTIKTTNDMPIVQPAGFQGLGLVPFQINPHYLDPDPATTHM